MKGLTLSVLVILCSLMLGASSGVALGSFIMPDKVPIPAQSVTKSQGQSLSTTASTSSDVNANDLSPPASTAYDEATTIGVTASKSSFAEDDDYEQSITQLPRSFPSNGVSTLIQPSVSVLFSGNVVQVSNQSPSMLLVGTCGDSNADGVFDVGDAVTSLQLAVGLEQATRFHEVFSDLNGDEVLNVLDTIKALQFLILQDLAPSNCGPFADQ